MYSQDAAPASRANAAGSAIAPRLWMSSVGVSNAATEADATPAPCAWRLGAGHGRAVRAQPVQARLHRRSPGGLLVGGVDELLRGVQLALRSGVERVRELCEALVEAFVGGVIGLRREQDVLAGAPETGRVHPPVGDATAVARAAQLG